MRKLTDVEARPIMLAAGLTPSVSYPGGNIPWLSKCGGCGRVVSPRYNSIQQGQGGCLVCAKKKVDPEIVMATMVKAGLEPLVPFPGALTPWRCKHACGRVVSPRYSSIQQGQGGCLICARKKVDPEVVMATMAMEGLTPLESYPGAMKPWLCRHECGREVRPRYSDIQQGGGGCRSCVSNKTGCVYLIELTDHQNFPQGVLKIGRTGSRTRRLHQWQQRGWSVLEVFHFDDGKIPPVVEREVLKWFNDDLRLEPCLSADDVGHMHASSETVSVADLTAAGVSVADVRKKVQQLVKEAGARPVTAGTR